MNRAEFLKAVGGGFAALAGISSVEVNPNYVSAPREELLIKWIDVIRVYVTKESPTGTLSKAYECMDQEGLDACIKHIEETESGEVDIEISIMKMPFFKETRNGVEGKLTKLD